VAELKMLLGLAWKRPKEAHTWHIPILKTSATQGEGIGELVEGILKHRVYLGESGQLAQRSQRQAQSEVLALLQHELMLHLQAAVGDGEWQQLLEAVVERRASPYDVADQLARRLGLRAPNNTPGRPAPGD
jgi:LAO/AO transport system kinase